MELTTLLGIVSILLGVAGIFAGYSLSKNKNKIGWSDIECGARDLINNRVEYINKELMEKDFIPDAILTFSGSASIIANLAMEEACKYLPIYLALIEDIRRGPRFSFQPINHFTYETTKWRVHIPFSIKELEEKKLLIIDHNTLTGDTLERLVELIVKEGGLRRDNIRVVSLICTKVAIDSGKAPDGIWRRIDAHDFYFPWGKGY